MRRLLMVAAAMLAWSAAIAALGSENALPTDSLYQLPAHLRSQTGAAVGLDLDRGHPTLVSMFYGSCPAACPMLITGIQAYESHLDPASRAHLRVLLVSFDAVRDTPQQLQHLAQLHRVDLSRWTFTSAPETDARRIAALLGISYRPLPDGSFDHSLLIALLDRQGRVVASTAKLVGDSRFQAQLHAAAVAEAP